MRNINNITTIKRGKNNGKQSYGESFKVWLPITKLIFPNIY